MTAIVPVELACPACPEQWLVTCEQDLIDVYTHIWVVHDLDPSTSWGQQ